MGVFTFEDGTEYDGPFEKDRMLNREIKTTTNMADSPEKETIGKKGKNDKTEKERPDSPKTAASKLAKKEVE